MLAHSGPEVNALCEDFRHPDQTSSKVSDTFSKRPVSSSAPTKVLLLLLSSGSRLLAASVSHDHLPPPLGADPGSQLGEGSASMREKTAQTVNHSLHKWAGRILDMIFALMVIASVAGLFYQRYLR